MGYITTSQISFPNNSITQKPLCVTEHALTCFSTIHLYNVVDGVYYT